MGPWLVYLAAMAVILFLYVRGWIFLQRYAGNIVTGLVQVSIPRQKLYLPITLSVVLLIVALLFRSQTAKWVKQIPLGLRGLLLPLPFYLIFTLNWSMTGLVLIFGVLAWLFYEPLARFLRLVLSPLPVALQVPLMRYWPVVLYVYLLTNLVHLTIMAAIGFIIFHLIDASMENYFAPVWNFQRKLAPVARGAISLVRLALGATAPFVLAYSWGLFNPLMDRYTALFAVLIFLVTYFIMRGPRAVVRILVPGILLGFGMGDVVWADNCSGGEDCYNTVGFNSAALAALFGGLGAVGLSLTLDFLPVIGELKSFYEFKTGRDLITGEKLPWWARLLALLGAIPIIGRLFKLGKFAKVADKLGDVARALDDAGDLARNADRANDAARAMDKAGDLARGADDPFPWVRDVNPLRGEMNCSWVAREVDEALAVHLRGDTPKPYAPNWFEPELQVSGLPPSSGLDDLADLHHIQSEYGSFFHGTSMQRIVEDLGASGHGSRGIIYVKSGDNAHVFNAVNWHGQIYFLDGQTGAVWTRVEDVLEYTGYDVWDDFKFLPTSG